MVRKVENVAHRRGPEGIDRLGVVAHDGQALAARLERQQDGGLQAVGVLIFVDQHMIEAGRELGGDRRIEHHVGPIEQEVVVIQHVLALLGLDIGGEQRPQFVFPVRAPWEGRAQHLVERGLRVHGARIDRQAGSLGRKPLLGLGETDVVADQIDQVGRILAIVNRERTVEADRLGIFPQDAGADRMECARPGEAPGHHPGAIPQGLRRDALDPAGHLGGRPAREGEEQDAARVGALHHQVGDAVSERVGLAGAGACDDQQRSRLPVAMLDGAALLGIERGERGIGHRRR